ncbi:hypothetical protein DFH06DRAFT_420653 [Mycena polygramma]|nr:hypothetical protein DFH06DRAFT_420653 [Mycena polygramma]
MCITQRLRQIQIVLESPSLYPSPSSTLRMALRISSKNSVSRYGVLARIMRSSVDSNQFEAGERSGIDSHGKRDAECPSSQWSFRPRERRWLNGDSGLRGVDALLGNSDDAESVGHHQRYVCRTQVEPTDFPCSATCRSRRCKGPLHDIGERGSAALRTWKSLRIVHLRHTDTEANPVISNRHHTRRLATPNADLKSFAGVAVKPRIRALPRLQTRKLRMRTRDSGRISPRLFFSSLF